MKKLSRADNFESMFEDWWEKTGKSLDPDPGVHWYDKRKEFADYAFRAAMAISRNYVADNESVPTEFIFANGRRVILGEDILGIANGDYPYLVIERKR